MASSGFNILLLVNVTEIFSFWDHFISNISTLYLSLSLKRHNLHFFYSYKSLQLMNKSISWTSKMRDFWMLFPFPWEITFPSKIFLDAFQHHLLFISYKQLVLFLCALCSDRIRRIGQKSAALWRSLVKFDFLLQSWLCTENKFIAQFNYSQTPVTSLQKLAQSQKTFKYLEYIYIIFFRLFKNKIILKKSKLKWVFCSTR